MRDLYFLAILPPWPLARKIDNIRHELWHRFGTQKTLNSPPHITLIPTFDFKDHQHLVAQFRRFAEDQPSFLVKCNGVDHFGEKTIFLGVEPNNALTDLQSRLVDFCRKELVLSIPGSTRPYHPHITLATKDLKRDQFSEAWKRVQQTRISESFQVDGFYLLRHSGKRWLIDTIFDKLSL